MKRVVAEPGDEVKFRQGYLYINGERRQEPYVKYRSDWELESRTVRPGHVYLIGDGNLSLSLKKPATGLSVRRSLPYDDSKI